jgi:hypothetical protein
MLWRATHAAAQTSGALFFPSSGTKPRGGGPQGFDRGCPRCKTAQPNPGTHRMLCCSQNHRGRWRRGSCAARLRSPPSCCPCTACCIGPWRCRAFWPGPGCCQPSTQTHSGCQSRAGCCPAPACGRLRWSFFGRGLQQAASAGRGRLSSRRSSQWSPAGLGIGLIELLEGWVGRVTVCFAAWLQLTRQWPNSRRACIKCNQAFKSKCNACARQRPAHRSAGC